MSLYFNALTNLEVLTIGRVKDNNKNASSIPIVSGSVQDTVPSLAYKLKLEQNDPLLRLHLPE